MQFVNHTQIRFKMAMATKSNFGITDFINYTLIHKLPLVA